MPTRAFSAGLLLIVLAAIANDSAVAQEPEMTDPPSVFLDCHTRACDSDHFRSEIRFVHWVREPADADVHLLITEQGTGGGGEQFRLAFTGLRRFDGDSARVTVTTDRTATAAERRDVLTNRIALALVRYAVHTDAAALVNLDMLDAGDAVSGTAATPADDAWNSWVFSTRLNATLDGESRERENEFELSLSADRVTRDWKIGINIDGSYEEEEFELSDRTLRSIRRDYDASILVVRSIAALWSAGLRMSAGSSSFENQNLFARVAPVLEYSFYPYAEFSRRQLTLQYSLGARYFDYREITVYDRMSEQRLDQELALSLDLRQRWGSAELDVSGAHYLHDVRRYSLSTSGNFNIRLVRGLSLDLWGRYSRVRDQIYIPRGDASDEEVLLRRRALETGYRYRTSVGLRYTFGSIFNSVINPRID